VLSVAPFDPLPRSAAWRHIRSTDGFETVFFGLARGGGSLISGVTTAVADGCPSAVGYDLQIDADWCTRSAAVWSRSEDGLLTTCIESDGRGRWTVDGGATPALDGCLDVDLESSACTNLLPLRRTRLADDGPVSAPAAYVRVEHLRVERLEQTYTRVRSPSPRQIRFHYVAPAFGFACQLTYDRSGLVVSYPSIAVRVR
jgi:hypothetical protein